MTVQIEPPHLNLQCLSSRFWRFMWWAWELFCCVLRIILFLVLLLLFTTGLGTSLLHLIIINLSNVSSFNLYLSGLNTLPPEQPFNSSWRSNSIDHYQTAPDLSVHCLLRYISVPIFGANTVFYLCGKCDKYMYNSILIQVHCRNPK